MKIVLLLFLLCLSSVRLDAQVVGRPDSLVFSGAVFHAETGKPMSDVTCRLPKGRGVISDGRGCFSVVLCHGDTVRFTYVGFRPCEIVIPDTLDAPSYMLGVFLSPDTLQLSEVVIVKRLGSTRYQNMVKAQNNMRGILRQAYNPDYVMDADMNQRMMISQYALEVEMKGHVDVALGVGTQSLDVLNRLKLHKKMKEKQKWLNLGEIDLLKRIYYAEKSKIITK